MPSRLERFHASGQSHFVTFCCYRRRTLFTAVASRRICESALERIRLTFALHIYGYMIMPEHVHLPLSEPERGTLAEAIKSLKQGVSRRLIGDAEHCWQKRYYDFNIRNARQFREKLRYIYRNPVRRGLCAEPENWEWSSFATMRQKFEDVWSLSRSGQPMRASGLWEDSAPRSLHPTQAKRRLEWATRPRPLWQPRYHDFNVFSEKKCLEKRRYIHRNPVTRGLVDRPIDWHWSSFRHWWTGGAGDCRDRIAVDGYVQGSSAESHVPTTGTWGTLGGGK